VQPARMVEAEARRSDKYPHLEGLFWHGPGFLTSAFAHGPGFKAFADDFPPGTRLRVTVEIVPPEGPATKDLKESHGH